jgi:hypothetical protein
MMHRRRSVCALEILESRLLFQAADPSPVPGPTNTGPVALSANLVSLNLGNLTSSTSPINTSGLSSTLASELSGDFFYNGTLYLENNGVTVQGLAISGGNVQIDGTNVTLQNFTLNGLLTLNGSGDVVNNGIMDAGCEFGTANEFSLNAAISVDADNATVENLSVTGTGGGGDAIAVNWGANGAVFSSLNIYNTGTTPFFLNGSATIEGCWLHDIGWNTLNLVNGSNVGGAHTDDVFVANASSVTLEGNYFENTATTDNGINYQINQNIMIQPFGSGDVIGAISITNNIIQGGGYMIYYEGGTSLTVANNEFGVPYFGFIYPNYVQGPIAWTNDIYQPTGQQLSAPVISGNSLVDEPQPEGAVTVHRESRRLS